MRTLEVAPLNHPHQAMRHMAATREHFTHAGFRAIIVLVGDYSERYGAVLQELLGAQVEIRLAKTCDASIELIVDPRVPRSFWIVVRRTGIRAEFQGS